jgi:hypothetical protein
MDLDKLKKQVQFDTAGRIAVASFILCGLSGILLAIPYDFSRAYSSLFELLVFNPAGSFVRNIHYWSAELFFVFTLLHIYDHFSKSTESGIKNSRIWLLLCLAVVFLCYEMLSGFILKGDAAGLQARRIMGSLLEAIPFAGNMLRRAFAGSEEHWLVIYIQHIGLGTIILLMGLYEHVKTILPRMKSFLVVFLGVILTSLFFRAPLGLLECYDLKGPWFFLGIQEMLHWISRPGYLVLFFLTMLLLLFILRYLSVKGKTLVKRLLLAFGIFYFFMVLMVLFFRGENWEWEKWSGNEAVLILDPVNLFGENQAMTMPQNMKPEGCLVCHHAMKGLSDSHNPAVVGCYVCHKGDPFSADKNRAHKNMILIPGNFSNVRQTCGTQNCHREISDRLMDSPMTIASGIVGIDKFVFGEATTVNDTFQVTGLGNSMADTHLRNLCAGCHLGNEKNRTGNAAWLERGGGCNGCHLHYDNKATASMKRMMEKSTDLTDEVHPTIDIQVSNDRCRSCHSRSGRISLSYEGWNETSMKSNEVTDTMHFKVLPDDRVVEHVSSDIHFQKGMACIDCHGSYEIMGDGKRHIHKEEAVHIQCVDCHPVGKPNSRAVGKLTDRESLMIAGLRKVDPGTRVVLTEEGNQPILNTMVDSTNRIFLTDKLTGQLHESKPISQVCSKGKGHNRLSCESCHSAWVPQCIGCHTTYEKNNPGLDMLSGKPPTGSWIEYAGKIMAEPPVLGINEKRGGKVVTAMPGMIMTIDKESFARGAGNLFYRLYAPVSGHTTQREGRSCKSCHNNPLAIGYGRGELKYNPSGTTGKWTFLPRFALNANDQLPEDAWIGFMKEATAPCSTRSGLRPFSVKEQQRILEVGSCLTCHDGKSKVMELALEDFEQSMQRRSKHCFK